MPLFCADVYAQISEWQEALSQLQSDVSARPLKQDMDAMSLLMEKQMKLLSRRLSRLSSQTEPTQPVRAGAGDVMAGDGDEHAAVMKKQLVTDFSCLSCDKKLLFARRNG